MDKAYVRLCRSKGLTTKYNENNMQLKSIIKVNMYDFIGYIFYIHI